MTFTDRIKQASYDRSARKAVRAEHAKLVRELSAYSTPAERMEIELLASRSDSRDSAMVLDILDQMYVEDTRIGMRRSA